MKKNIKAAILAEFESGNYNTALIAQHLDKARMSIMWHVENTPVLNELWQVDIKRRREEREAINAAIIESVKAVGIRQTAILYKRSRQYVEQLTYAQRKGAGLVRASKELEKKSKYYVPFFPY